ncbi:SDR family oxidoreductase [Streptomyces sp. Tu102]|uniref:SDR family oxidoreductase n=1 Tax=Streptomyces TaxID=1883 RepID=UPI001BDD0A72|nr:SDR family oxidoreductase [Streptomyces sp. Tu102]MBT1098055.1 SDR family oxidoreductase [Streptomyces sp. Tu102]
MRNALITGASSGIGRALAFQLAKRGYNLALLARRSEELVMLKEQIVARHPDLRVETRVLDVTDYDQVPQTLNELAAALGRLDVVVAGAGVGSYEAIGTGNAHIDRGIVATNLLGAMATIDAATAIMRAQGRGQIVAISSVAAYRGLAGAASYSASKAAIAVYADSLRAELHGTSISVTTLFPGYIDTPLNAGLKSRPFLVSLEKGAAQIANKIERGVKSSTVPTWPWAILGPLLRVLPTQIIARMNQRP